MIERNHVENLKSNPNNFMWSIQETSRKAETANRTVPFGIGIQESFAASCADQRPFTNSCVDQRPLSYSCND